MARSKSDVRRLKKLYPELAARGRYTGKKKRPSKPAIWTPDKYKFVVKGGTVVSADKERRLRVAGLRDLAYGFDDYDLRHPEKWTKAQRQKIRTMFHRVSKLQGQSKRLVRTRSEENLRYLQKVFHGQVPSKDFKVAWVHDIEPQLSFEPVKRRPPKIRIIESRGKKVGVSIGRREFNRLFVEFNKKLLVINPRQEIARAANEMPNAKLYYVAVDEFTTLNGKSIGQITKDIVMYMEKYDGEKPLPKSSGNYGDDPRHHHWSRWLNGLVGIETTNFRRAQTAARMISEGRQKAMKLQRERTNLLKRMKLKPKGR